MRTSAPLTISCAFLAIASSLAPVAVMAQPVPASAASEVAPVSLADGYVLGTGDVIEVSVAGREDFRPRIQLQADGTIELPLIGTLQAANKTVLQLRDEIRQRLRTGGYFPNPVVNITVATFASRYVVVQGEVGTPGIVPVDRAYRVSEILARAGGRKESGSDTLVLTRVTGEKLELNVQTIATGVGEDDPVVNPGDKIFIAPAKTFYIYGQVAAPGNYRVDGEMTLRKAVARGGGLTQLGSEKRVKVIREGKEIKKFPPDDPILPGDVVVVGERFF